MIIEPLTQSEENIKQAIEEVLRDGQSYNLSTLRDVIRSKVNIFGYREVILYLLRERVIESNPSAVCREDPYYRLTSTI